MSTQSIDQAMSSFFPTRLPCSQSECRYYASLTTIVVVILAGLTMIILGILGHYQIISGLNRPLNMSLMSGGAVLIGLVVGGILCNVDLYGHTTTTLDLPFGEVETISRLFNNRYCSQTTWTHTFPSGERRKVYGFDYYFNGTLRSIRCGS